MKYTILYINIISIYYIPFYMIKSYVKNKSKQNKKLEV